MTDPRAVERLIFISYSHEDASLASKLDASFTSAGLKTFRDQKDIRVGDSIPEKIFEFLGKATDLVIVISKDSVESSWAKKELDVALTRQREGSNLGIFPIRVGNVEIPRSISHLRYGKFVDWTSPEAFQRDFLDLAASMDIYPTLIEGDEVEWWLSNFPRFADVISELWTLLGRVDLAASYPQWFLDGETAWVLDKAMQEDLRHNFRWQELASEAARLADSHARFAEISHGLSELPRLVDEAAGSRSEHKYGQHERIMKVYWCLSKILSLLAELDQVASTAIGATVQRRREHRSHDDGIPPDEAGDRESS